MPYKNKKDKAAWRRRNRHKQKEYRARWQRVHAAEIEAKRLARLKPRLPHECCICGKNEAFGQALVCSPECRRLRCAAICREKRRLHPGRYKRGHRGRRSPEAIARRRDRYNAMRRRPENRIKRRDVARLYRMKNRARTLAMKAFYRVRNGPKIRAAGRVYYRTVKIKRKYDFDREINQVLTGITTLELQLKMIPTETAL